MSMWQIEPMMNREIHVYWVVSYELCNHIIVRPFKGDEFLCDEYCDEIHCGNPMSWITLSRNELNDFENNWVVEFIGKVYTIHEVW